MDRLADSRFRCRHDLPGQTLENPVTALAALARRYDQEAHAPLLSVPAQRLLLAPLLLPARRARRLGAAA